MKVWPLVAQKSRLGNASSLGGSLERLEWYLNWPLKLCNLQGGKSWRPYRACLNKDQKIQPTLLPWGSPCGKAWLHCLGMGMERHSVPHTTGPPLGLPSYASPEIALFGWPHSLLFINMIKWIGKKEQVCYFTGFSKKNFFLNKQKKYIVHFDILFSTRTTMSVETGNLSYWVNVYNLKKKQVFSQIF